MSRFITALLLILCTFQVAAVNYENEFQQIEARYQRVVPHINKLSTQFDISPELITTVIYKESTFKPAAKNPKSTATGLLQIIRPTAKSMIAKYGKTLGVRPGANLRDPIVNLKIGVAYLHDVRGVMTTRLKRVPTDAEIYLGFKYSPERATRMIQHRGGTKMVDFYSAAAAGNPKDYYRKGKSVTVRETRTNITRSFKHAKAYYGPKIAEDVAKIRLAEQRELVRLAAMKLFNEAKAFYAEAAMVQQPIRLAQHALTYATPRDVFTGASVKAYDGVLAMTSGRTYKGIPL